jgi:hypothetical protein
MNTNKLFGLLAALVLVFGLVGCSFTVDLGNSAPMPTLMPTLMVAQPTYTPYPTQVPPTPYPTAIPVAPVAPTADISSILRNNGFSFLKNDTLNDGTSCNDYMNTEYSILAITCQGGIFSIGQVVADNSQGQTDMVVNIVRAIYGTDVANWVINHAPDAINGNQQTTIVGNLHISLTLADDMSEFMLTFILL